MPLIKVVCTGSVILKDDKRGVAFTVLGSDGKETEDQLVFSKNKNTNKCCCQIYEIERTETGISGAFKWIGDYTEIDKVRCTEMYAEHKSIETHFQIIARERKAAARGNDVLEDALRPLSKIYHGTNAQGKAALIAQVITYMQRRL